MPPFAYLRDPLFLVCVMAYFVNRIVIRPFIDGGFMHNHFNDLICIPFWTPFMVWLAHTLGLRTHDRRPEGVELLIPLIVWAFVFEIWLPQSTGFKDHVVGDYRDILWYTAGALAASVIWDWWYQPTFSANPTRTLS
jgi:hypothetical protein